MRTESQMSPVVRRINAIAKAEFRTFEGQLAAMLQLWQEEHGDAAPVRSVGRPKKSTKPKAKVKRGFARHTPESRKKISEAMRLSHAKRRLQKLKTYIDEQDAKKDVVTS